jgi:hypothetical protein
MGVSSERHASVALAPRKRAGLGGHRSLCGSVRKPSPSPGFEIRTVHSVSSLYNERKHKRFRLRSEFLICQAEEGTRFSQNKKKSNGK